MMEKPQIVNDKIAAQMFPVFSVHWFRRARCKGKGPKYIKIGKRIGYRVKDLEDYFNNQPVFLNTSEYNKLKNVEKKE